MGSKKGTILEKYPCDKCGEDTMLNEDDKKTITSDEILCGRCRK